MTGTERKEPDARVRTGDVGWIGSLQPDRLAELHTLRELTASPELAQACLSGLDPRQALRAVPLLARASADYPDAEELLRQTLPSVADVIAGMQAPVETLTAIYNAIPYPTVILAPAAAALCQQIINLLPDDSTPATRAFWLETLGVRLSALGRPAEVRSREAMTTYQDATAVYRETGDQYREGITRQNLERARAAQQP